jgi:hypothetical protein
MRYAVVLATVLFSLAANAEPDASTARARALFEAGAAAAKESRWSDALKKFEASAALRRHATTTYNLGFCERALGHATRARKYFRAAIAEDKAASAPELSGELREVIPVYLEEIEEQIASPTLELAPAGSKIGIDGRPLEGEGERMIAGTLPEGPAGAAVKPKFIVDVDAGNHEIVVVAPDGRSRVFHEYFSPRSHKTILLDVGMPPPPPPRAIDTDSAPRRYWGYSIGAAGIVALGIGTYFAVSARSNYSDAREACPNRLSCPDDRAAVLSREARTDANTATVVYAIGAVAVTSGLILVLSSRTTTIVNASPTSASFSFVTRF